MKQDSAESALQAVQVVECSRQVEENENRF